MAHVAPLAGARVVVGGDGDGLVVLAGEQAGGDEDDARLEVVLAQRPLLIGGGDPLDVGEFHRVSDLSGMLRRVIAVGIKRYNGLLQSS